MSSGGVRFGLVGSGQRPEGMPADPGRYRAVAELAEEAGFDSLWATDHLAFASPILEGLVALSLFAGCTRRIALGAGVYLLPLRHPVAVAKQVATLDWLSGGRVVFGVGLGGDSVEEFDAVGVPLAGRGRLVEEGIDCLRALWAGGPATYRGERWSFEGVELRPPPSRPGGPPILLGGGGPRTLRRVGERCDGWLAHMPGPDAFARDWATVRGHARAAGRDPDALEPLVLLPTHVDRDEARGLAVAAACLERRYGRGLAPAEVAARCLVGTPATIRARIGEYVAAGVRHVVLNPLVRDEGELAGSELLAREVVAPLRAAGS